MLKEKDILTAEVEIDQNTRLLFVFYNQVLSRLYSAEGQLLYEFKSADSSIDDGKIRVKGWFDLHQKHWVSKETFAMLSPKKIDYLKKYTSHTPV